MYAGVWIRFQLLFNMYADFMFKVAMCDIKHTCRNEVTALVAG